MFLRQNIAERRKTKDFATKKKDSPQSPLRGLYYQGQRGKGKAGKALRKRKKRRSAVEPKIGHMKFDNRMGRNFLKGVASFAAGRNRYGLSG